jgi:hypothetical protein
MMESAEFWAVSFIASDPAINWSDPDSRTCESLCFAASKLDSPLSNSASAPFNTLFMSNTSGLTMQSGGHKTFDGGFRVGP